MTVRISSDSITDFLITILIDRTPSNNSHGRMYLFVLRSGKRYYSHSAIQHRTTALPFCVYQQILHTVPECIAWFVTYQTDIKSTREVDKTSLPASKAVTTSALRRQHHQCPEVTSMLHLKHWKHCYLRHFNKCCSPSNAIVRLKYPRVTITAHNVRAFDHLWKPYDADSYHMLADCSHSWLHCHLC